MKARAVRLPVATILALATGLCSSNSLHAGGDAPSARPDVRHERELDRGDEDSSQDRAQRAHEAGEILSLAEIYKRARQETRGRILEADLERANGHWVYELTIMDPQGGVFDLDLDGATGKVLGREEAD